MLLWNTIPAAFSWACSSCVLFGLFCFTFFLALFVFLYLCIAIKTFLELESSTTEIQYLEVHLFFLLKDTGSASNHLFESGGVVHLLVNDNQSTGLTVNTRCQQFAGCSNNRARLIGVNKVIEQ